MRLYQVSFVKDHEPIYVVAWNNLDAARKIDQFCARWLVEGNQELQYESLIVWRVQLMAEEDKVIV